MIDYRLHTFLTVCRYMNYTKAARELFITQPAVSQHIRYLEKYYGVRLFDYRGKTLTLSLPAVSFWRKPPLWIMTGAA